MEHQETLVALDALIRYGLAVFWGAVTVCTIAQLAKGAAWFYRAITENRP